MAPVLGGRALPAGEGRRKLVHAGMGAFALLFRFLTWPQAVPTPSNHSAATVPRGW